MNTNTEQGHSVNYNQAYSKIGEQLYLNSEKADVHFLIESTGERIPAHKILLSSANDVFDTMFHGSLKEKGDIRIVDASAMAFKEFLRFFYFKEIDLTMENVAEVMYLGEKYMVNECLRLGTNLLIANITTENVVTALSLAITHEQKRLLELCESKISSNSKEILQSSSFIECDRQALNHVLLNMEKFSCSKADVFRACMSWVRAASKQDVLTRDIVQTHLGHSFYAFRFGSMSLDEFSELLPSYGELFTAAEYNEILQTIHKQERQAKMLMEPRVVCWDERCERDLIKRDKWGFFERTAVTRFSTNMMLILVEFACTRIMELRSLTVNTDVGVTVHDFQNKQIQTQFTFDKVYNELRRTSERTIKLPEPVIIQPGIKYDICLIFPSNRSHSDSLIIKNSNSVRLHQHNIVIHFHEVDGATAGIGV